MSTATKQDKLSLQITTPLGANKLILDQFRGTEGISRPFHYILDMHANDASIDPKKLIGKSVTVTFNADGGKRYFNGIVGQFRQGATKVYDKNSYTFYQAELFPKFWLLKFTCDHIIYQNKKTIDIIKEGLQKHQVSEIEEKISSCGQNEREFCVQYGESYFDFLSRLMEEEGIYYYFTHTESGHKMVLADNSLNASAAVHKSIEMEFARSDRHNMNKVTRCDIIEQVTAKEFAVADYNYTTPSTKLYSKQPGQDTTTPGGEVYRYPGYFQKMDEGENISKHRIQALEWEREIIAGTSTVPLFNPGETFTLAKHPNSSANQTYVLYEVEHRINMDAQEFDPVYTNDFKGFPSKTEFRPPIMTPRPRISGSQTAEVTGKEGEEIWTDEYGRVKVHFYWDRVGEKNEKSSCWVRVGQAWAMSNWGVLFTPRIGQEVIVEFLEGDPDRPIITGCVWNGDHKPPYATESPTKSTIKTNSSKGGGGYNELRFEDKKGEEEIYLQAEKDMNRLIKDNRTLKIEKGNDTNTIVAGNRTTTLKGESASGGNDTLTLSTGNRTVELMSERGEPVTHKTHIVMGNKETTIDKGDIKTTIMMGNHSLTMMDGNKDITMLKGNTDITCLSGNTTQTILQGNTTKLQLEGNENTIIMGSRDRIVGEAETLINIQGKTEVVVESRTMIAKNLTIIVEEALNIISGQSISMIAAQGISMTAGAELSLTAGASFSAKAGASAEIQAGASLSASAGASVSINGATVTVDGALISLA